MLECKEYLATWAMRPRARRPEALLRITLAVAVVLAPVAPAGASTMLLCSDATMCRLAQAVVVGRVESTGAAWDVNHHFIKTLVGFRVDEWLKGPPARPDRIVLTHVGGTIDGKTTYQAGAPRFTAGEKAVVFLELDPSPPPGVDVAWHVLGLARGKYTVTQDPATGRETVVMCTDGLTFLDPATGLPTGPCLLPVEPGKLELEDLLSTLREASQQGQ